MGRTARTEPQCLYKGSLYLYLHKESVRIHMARDTVQGYEIAGRVINF